MDVLYQISLKDFLNNNPNIKVMEKGLQEKRYQHHEEKRINRINHAIERRRDMINNPEKNFSKVFFKF